MAKLCSNSGVLYWEVMEGHRAEQKGSLLEGCWLTETTELFMNRGLGWSEQDIHEHCTTKWFVVVVMRSGLLIFVGALVWACSVYLENKGIEALVF